jgi:diguanylate cyclase (GGDEF)-like protein
MSQGLCLFDRDERIVFVNRRLPEIMGLPPSFYEPGTRFADLLQRLANIRHAAGFGDRDADALYRMHIEKLRAREESANTIVLAGGQTIGVRHSPVGDGSWVMTCEDITARYAVEQKIAYMSRHDGLTGLPNRLALEGFLHHALEAPTDATRLALVSIDLDRFKEINDQHGHAVGDAMLSALAARMRPLVGPGEICARIGGDEFVIVKQVQHRDELDALIEPLMTEINAPIRLGNVALLASSSVGVALYPDDARDGDQLLNNAALAVSRAKATRRGSVCVFEAEMDEIARSRRKMAGELWTAIERDEFIVHYQVQKAVETGEITGYEALVRWEHPARGRVPPTEFIPVAEECGAILKLGEWVLRQACRDAVHWLTPFRVAVNLSPVQLGHADLVGMVKSVLAETGLPPERLELEITESTIVADKPRALHLLRQIKELGVSIAIDDFGTGYSSLDTLNSFPFDKIKIDRSFLMASDERPQSKSIVRAILALGRTLGMRVLAEGVETETQLGLLRQEGCFEGQGYLFGRPAGILACQR